MKTAKPDRTLQGSVPSRQNEQVENSRCNCVLLGKRLEFTVCLATYYSHIIGITTYIYQVNENSGMIPHLFKYCWPFSFSSDSKMLKLVLYHCNFGIFSLTRQLPLIHTASVKEIVPSPILRGSKATLIKLGGRCCYCRCSIETTFAKRRWQAERISSRQPV